MTSPVRLAPAALEPLANPAGGVFDRIAVHAIHVRAHHGVLDHERRDGQDFYCDVVLHLDTAAAGAGDDLAATVHYGEVTTDVVAVLESGPVDLVETLAERVADAVLARTAVRGVDVTIHKPHAPVGHPVADVTVTIRRLGPLLAPPHGPGGTPRPAPVALGLGANLGDARRALADAVHALADEPGLTVTAVSPLARTAPVLASGQESQPDYLNAVVLARTTLAPLALLAAVQRIEAHTGRVRSERWGPRVLDIDLLDVDGLEVSDPTLTLPHPRAAERAFVQVPWAWARGVGAGAAGVTRVSGPWTGAGWEQDARRPDAAGPGAAR